jgi:hypothetical protein
MSRARALNVPRPARVSADAGGAPVAVGGTAVEAIREDWVVEDRWWTEQPLHRHYYEAVLADGRCAVVFRAVATGRWYRQAA